MLPSAVPFWPATGIFKKLEKALAARDLRLSVRCIKTHTPISFNGLTYKMITSSKTGRVWLDRNLGATQVATKADDSAAYIDSAVCPSDYSLTTI
jgi:hypothetical protein